MVGVVCIVSFCSYIGLVMYAYFRHCDPIESKVSLPFNVVVE